MGERASNLFGVLLSLTFFSVLLAVMLVAVSILPDGPSLAPPTVPGETRRSGPVRTPVPVTLGELGLAPAPELVPAGAALASVTFTTGLIPPPAGPSGPGGGTVTGPNRGPTRGPGLGQPDDGFRRPGSTRTDRPAHPGKGLGHLKREGESGHPKRGPGFLRCEEESATGKGRAKGRCDGPGSTNGGGGGRGKGSGKGGSSGGAVHGGGSGHGGSQGGNGLGLGHVKAKGNGLGLGHVKAKGNGHGNGHGKGHSKHM